LTFLADLSVTDARAWLTELCGVGPKTASCVLMFSLDRPAMPVDTHVHRLSKRLGLIPPRASAEAAHELLEAIIPPDDIYETHLLFIRHGRQTCVARKPRCAACILVQCCPTARTMGIDEQG
jgi:endonuclease-3